MPPDGTNFTKIHNSHLMSNYLFTSQRLGFRNWKETDFPLFAEMNKRDDVMQYFPFRRTSEESVTNAQRMQKHLEERGFTYFAVDHLEQKEFIGFIGLQYQDYPSPYTPFVDIGWRLRPKFWGKGLATEGAKSCLEFAFKKIGLKEIYSVTTWNNSPSINVMKKIGMQKEGEFVHPNMAEDHELQPMVVYKIDLQG